jgi:puromycin-sensitive aminopeptidase
LSRRNIRLSPDVRPSRVAVHVEVDPAAGNRFRGQVSIDLRADRPVRTLELHAVDLTLSKARVEWQGRELRGSLEPRPERESVAVKLEDRIEGEARLHLTFAGDLRSDLRGLYAATSGERKYAFTQLEATDARRFFPCFDEPGMKARFSLSVETDAKNAVLSNAPVAREEKKAGRKTVWFRETPPLSTYLVALGVGELECSEPEMCGETEIRVWHVPGKGNLTGFALETARETLGRLEKYFALPYPYEKLDLVAVPDFEAGAMENAGAVFFRETLLLVDTATVTMGEKKRVAEVICHELAHMWYGDLVTMAWWDDLWLNEAFATWMAFQIVDDWKPEWKMWNDFQHYRAAALDLDALSTTHPIYVPVHSPEEATANFDLITYEKGASVVRMIERYLGPAAFRRGVRKYIRRHREGNTVAADLWNALSESSGQDVEPVVRAWIETSGFPLVSVKRRGSKVELRQERFRLKPRKGDRAKWPVPWVGRVGSKPVRHLLTRARETVPAPAGRFLYGNADEGGFFRPLHGTEELRNLTTHMKSLRPAERMGLLGHQWAAVRADHAAIDGWLDLALSFGGETDPDVLVQLRGPLGFIDDRLATDAQRQPFRNRIIETFGEQLVELGWDPAEDEDDETRLRRAAIISILGDVAVWEPVTAAAEKRFHAWLGDRSALDANLADSVVSLAARSADEDRYATFLNAMETAPTPQERRRFLLALGSVGRPSLADRTLKLALTDAVPTQDVAFVYVRLLQNRAARDRTWSFLQRRWKAVRRRLPPALVTRLIDATPSLGTPQARREVAQHFKDNPVATGERAVKQALERFSLDAALRKRARPVLDTWLHSKT